MHKLIPALLAGVASLAASTAFGQSSGADRHFYLGADLGPARMDQPDIVGVAEPSDENAFSWSLKVGYRFNPYFSLEAGYLDLGEFEHDFRGACTMQFPSNCGGAGDTRTSVDGFLVNAAGSLPVSEHLQLRGSVGAIHRKVEYSAPTSNIGPRSSSSEGTAWRIGLGLGIPINERLEIGLDLVHYPDVGVAFDMSSGALRTQDDGDATSLTFGMRLLF